MKTKLRHIRRFIAALDEHPPWTVRVMARCYAKGHFPRPMTTDELVAATGLTRRTLDKISYSPSWKAFSLTTIESYCYGAGVDILSTIQYNYFFRKWAEKRFDGFQPAQRRKFEKLEAEFKNGKTEEGSERAS